MQNSVAPSTFPPLLLVVMVVLLSFSVLILLRVATATTGVCRCLETSQLFWLETFKGNSGMDDGHVVLFPEVHRLLLCFTFTLSEDKEAVDPPDCGDGGGEGIDCTTEYVAVVVVGLQQLLVLLLTEFVVVVVRWDCCRHRCCCCIDEHTETVDGCR